MADIMSIDYGNIVKADGGLYWVYGTDCEKRTANLVPVELLDAYGNDENALEAHGIVFPARAIQKLNPVCADKNVLRSFFRLETTPWELAKQELYPFGSVTGRLSVTEEDMLTFIGRLREIKNIPLLDAWKDNFIYDCEADYHADYPDESDSPGFSLGYFCGRVISVLEWSDSDERDFDIIYSLRDSYLASKGKPISETVIPEDFRGDLLSAIESYAQKHTVTGEVREYYVKLLDELSHSGFEDDIKRKAYAYYGGNDVVPCNWKESEEALLRLYELTRDGYAANSLGYIYYSNRLGEPDYEKAFFYFNDAAGKGVIEAQYKLSDLYRKGHGTRKNPEKAWKIISELYKESDKKHKDKRKFPDIALRMGYCYRDGTGTEKDTAKALSCFTEAREGIELRIKKHKGFGDETVLKNVLAAIESVGRGVENEEPGFPAGGRWKLRFFIEWGGNCLWPDSADKKTSERFGIDPVTPEELGVSAELCSRLNGLDDEYQTALDWDAPQNPSPWTDEHFDDFFDRLESAFAELCRELEKDYEITYCMDRNRW